MIESMRVHINGFVLVRIDIWNNSNSRGYGRKEESSGSNDHLEFHILMIEQRVARL